MRLPINQKLPIAALSLLLLPGVPAQARDRTDPFPANGPQADYPMVLGRPFVVDGVTYTPADTLNYDVVGWAATSNIGSGISASHRTLPLPSYVEITALDTGRTILVRLERRGPMTGDLLTELSPAAAEQLGILGMAGAAVRVRRVNPPEPERAALRAGRPAPVRMETPASLRAVLMRRLEQQGAGSQVSRPGPMPTPDRAAAAPPAVSAAPVPAPKTAPQRLPTRPPAPPPVAQTRVAEESDAIPVPTGWLVQVAAFSTKERAYAVAAALGADLVSGGGLWRVQFVGLPTRAVAEVALARAQEAGFEDARIEREE